MKPMQILQVCILAAALFIINADQTTQAESTNGGYVLRWWSQDNGGQVNAAPSGYALSSALAQPDALAWSGGQYRLVGGFWSLAIRGLDYDLFLPNIGK